MKTFDRVLRMIKFIIQCNLTSLYLLFHLLIKRLKAFLSTSNNNTSNLQPPKLKFIRHDPKQSATPKDTLLLLHGFPDGPMVWENTVDALTKEGYRCVVVAFPSSGGEKMRVLPKLSGFLEELREVAEGEEGGMSVIAHDWGAFLANVLIKKYPSVFKRAVILDVGGMSPTTVPLSYACLIAYQVTFALCYMVGEGAGSQVMHKMFKSFRYAVRPIDELTADMAFWYVMILPEIFNRHNDITFDLKASETVPTMYIYGKKKLFMFHNEDWITTVRKSPCGHVEGFYTDHWITVYKPNEFNKLCIGWLQETEAHSSAASSQLCG